MWSRRALPCLLLALACPTSAHAETFAPPDTPGPPLSVAQAKLDSALTCSPGLDTATRAPVLLIQGTGANAKDNWSWTYEPALDKLQIAWCQVDLPDHATNDVQVNGEYVVNAIRTMSGRAGRRISIIGHSQGGMVGRWALRFWPDTRAMVEDVIGFAPSNHGTTQADCSATQPCSASGWQQSDGAHFIQALNSFQETFAPIAYTNVYTHLDEVVRPNADDTGSSSLHTGDGRITNVATQDICPSDPFEHLLIGLVDPVAYALAIDALDHDGPADPARIPVTTCAQLFHPGINPATVLLDGAAAAADYAAYTSGSMTSEPPLACYTTASCDTAAPACAASRRLTVRVRLLRSPRATLDGKRVALRRRGRQLVATFTLHAARTTTAVLRVRGRDARGRRVLITRRYPCAALAPPKGR